MSGLNIAFAAGTGVITFMDVVAAIARHNLKLDDSLGTHEDEMNYNLDTS